MCVSNVPPQIQTANTCQAQNQLSNLQILLLPTGNFPGKRHWLSKMKTYCNISAASKHFTLTLLANTSYINEKFT